MKIILAGFNLDYETIKEARAASPAAEQFTPETVSAAYARIRRNPAPVNELRAAARKEVEKARRSNQAIVFDMGHSTIANSLNSLAELYREQGQFAQAEPLYKRSLAILEKTLGPDHPDVAQSLNNLAELYRTQGQYAEAEPLFKRALAIMEKALGPDHLKVAPSLNSLAMICRAQDQYAQAEPLYKRSLAILEKSLGPDHPDVATSLENLALLYRASKREKEAEELKARAARIRSIKR